MFGSLEIVFILVIVLLLFGPDKIPDLARSVGIAIAEFKKAQRAAQLSNSFDMSGFDKYNRESEERKKAEEKALFEKIKQMAEEAGIPTAGKSVEELIALISAKMDEEEQAADAGVTERPEKSAAFADTVSENDK